MGICNSNNSTTIRGLTRYTARIKIRQSANVYDGTIEHGIEPGFTFVYPLHTNDTRVNVQFATETSPNRVIKITVSRMINNPTTGILVEKHSTACWIINKENQISWCGYETRTPNTTMQTIIHTEFPPDLVLSLALACNAHYQAMVH